MSKAQKVISTDIVPAKVSSTVHVKSIGVEFKEGARKRHICILIKLDKEKKEERSEWFGPDTDINWKYDRQIASSSQLSVFIREYHRVHSNKNIAAVSIRVEQLFMKHVFRIDGEEGQEKLTVKIECEATGAFAELIRRLMERSKDRLESMNAFIERLGTVCVGLSYIVSITEAVAEVHPAAQAAVSTANMLYEACKNQQECHVAASDLMADIESYISFTEVPADRLKSDMTARTVQDMLVLFEKITKMIIEYSRDSVLGLLLNDRREEIRTFKENFMKLKETFLWCITTEIWKTTLKIEASTDAVLLRLLDPVTDAFYKCERICFEGSRNDTLRMIEDWSSTACGPKLLWLHGSEGSGKTVIAHTIAKRFHDQSRLAGCFFVDKSTRKRQNPESVMPTIAYQLAKWHAAYHSNIVSMLQGGEETIIHSGLAGQYDMLIKRPLTEISDRTPPVHKSLIIVLDGLDECNDSTDSRHSLAYFVTKIATVVPWLKVIISGRKSSKLKALETDDVQQFDVSNPSLDLHHDITALVRLLGNHHDISTGGGDQFERDVKGLFLRIRASLEMLDLTNAELDSADYIIQGWTMVDTLFLLATRALVGNPDYDANGTLLLKDILAEISCISLQGSLSEGALLEFLQPLHPKHTPDQLRTAILILHPFVIEDHSGKVQSVFSPLQFLDFPSDEKRYGKLGPELYSTNIRLVRRCLDTMHSQLRFNFCGLESSYLKNEEVLDLASRIRACISDVLRYSCLHWMDHVSRAGDIESLQGPVRDFLLSPKALYWIEVLSVVGALDAGKNILLKCADHFKDGEEIVCAAQELHKFISDFSPVMEMSTPHVYVSALSWHRPSSLIASNCKGPSQHRGAAEPYNRSSGVNCDRGPHLDFPAESLRLPWRIAISPDGTSVVAGFEDGVLQIWNTQTGKAIIELLKGHKDAITCLSFSPGGTRVASGSTDKTVQMWDVESGASVAGPFKGHTDSVWAVAYSPDGSRIVSGSYDGTIRISDARSGTPIGKPLKDHVDSVYAVAYSPDGSRIVSGSFDRRVRIWDAHSGAPVGEPLAGHVWPVACVSYSPDGRNIVSGSWDKTVRLWDAQSGSQIGPPMKGHTGWVESVGYSADGSRIISGSADKTLRIWDAQSGAAIGVVPRGESRWDSKEGCFVSIESWWPSFPAPTVQSLIHSNEPLHVPGDGWLKTLDGGLFLWVPPQYRNDVDALSRINWRRVCHGTDWTEIMDREGSDDQ